MFLIFLLIILIEYTNTICMDGKCSVNIHGNEVEIGNCMIHCFEGDECESLEMKGQKSTKSGQFSLIYEPTFPYFLINYENNDWNTVKLRINSDKYSERFCQKIEHQQSQTYCLGIPTEVENVPYVIEYKAMGANGQVDVRKLGLIVPKNVDSIRDKPLFIYVDYTDLSKLILHIQTLPTNYTVEYYKVTVWRERSDGEIDKFVENIPANNREEIIYTYYTYNGEGTYSFTVSIISSPDCPDGLCFETKSSKIYLEKKRMSIVIGIICASLIIPLALFAFYCRNWRQKKYRNWPGISILVLAKASGGEHHIRAVNTFGVFLEEIFKKPVKIDVIDDTLRSKDCCSDTLISANCIIYIVSPPTVSSNQNEREHVDYMVHTFIKNHVGKNKKSTTNHRKNIMSIMFDYSDIKRLPHVLTGTKRYELGKEMKKFLQQLGYDPRKHGNYSTHPRYMELKQRINDVENCLNNDADTESDILIK